MAGLEMKYFVLNPKSKHLGDKYARAARCAMEQYAISIEPYNPELAKDLLDWIDREEIEDE